MKRSGQCGFTLIELLVVIAIIGILATLILVALNAVRLRARDARITANIANIATAMEICGDAAGGNYSDCGSDPSVGKLVDDIVEQEGDPSGSGATATRWCASSTLRSDPAKFVCRDVDGDAYVNGREKCNDELQCVR